MIRVSELSVCDVGGGVSQGCERGKQHHENGRGSKVTVSTPRKFGDVEIQTVERVLGSGG